MQHSSVSYHQGHAFFTDKKYVRHRTRPPPMVQYLHTFLRSMDHRLSNLVGTWIRGY